MSLADAARIKALEADLGMLTRRVDALEADPTAVEILERLERLENGAPPEPKRGPGRPKKGT